MTMAAMDVAAFIVRSQEVEVTVACLLVLSTFKADSIKLLSSLDLGFRVVEDYGLCGGRQGR